MNSDSPTSARRNWIGPGSVALAALLLVVLTLDAAGDYPALFEGPGITLDESFNVQMGVYQWRALREYHVALLHPDSVREVFGPGSNYNPDHPPLGRLWLGFWHDLVEWLVPPRDHPATAGGVRFVTDCARVGSATAFALTVFLIGAFATKWYGRAAGIVAAVSLVLMPRVFAHAHLASLETFMNLTYSAAVLAVAEWWPRHRCGDCDATSATLESGPTHVSLRVALLTGVLFGLALLSKIQGILIPPLVGLWALWHWRLRAIKPLLVFGFVGFMVFLLGWPFLWLDPQKHVLEYFARTTSRSVLNCFYGGQVWHDKDVPWHYPFVMFAATVPVGLHALGLLGVIGGPAWRRPHEQLLVLATLLPLLLFAVPGIAVYDGERLFLISYPMWAMLIGRGADIAFRYLRQRTDAGRWQRLASNRSRAVATAVFLWTQSVGVIVMHPCQLSYYNLLVGGLAGAERLGFERTYWQDSVTRELLTSLPTGASGAPVEVLVQPVLHQFQLDEWLAQSPILRQKHVRLRALHGPEIPGKHSAELLVLTFFRKADVNANDRPPGDVTDGYSVSRQSVPLSEWRRVRSK